MKRFGILLILLGLGLPLAGCIVEEPGHGGGWCFWHPGRCR